jgi:EmrB/QacA subfamily drug resistance transporter
MPDTRVAPVPIAVVRPHLPLAVIVAIACIAQFMVVLDSTIVVVALPAMRRGLDLSGVQQQWALTGYLVALGGFLLLGARAADLFGHRRVFLLGTVVFTVASLAGGLATDATMLLGARLIEGIGAAALAPASLSLITASHTDERQRHRALALWSVMGGSASAFGLVVGGVLTTELSWRWVLFVNVPIGAFLLVVAAISLLPGGRPDWRGHLDLRAALTVTLGMGSAVYGLSEGSVAGWSSALVVTALVACGVLLAGFVAIEARGARPLIPLSLFHLRILKIGNLLMMVLGAVMTSAMFFLSLYLQQALGYSALDTGLALVPMTVVLVASGLAARRLVPMVGPRRLLVVGGLIAACGLGWLSFLPTHSAYLAHIFGPTIVAGAGIGLMLLSVTLTATSGVDTGDAGAASGLLNSARQLGGALGLAMLVTVASGVTTQDALHVGHLAAVVYGYHIALLVAAAVMLTGGLGALALPASS